MVQLRITRGSQAGQCIEVASFPFQVGRQLSNHLVLYDPGVWDQHLSLEWAEGRIEVSSSGHALVAVNGHAIERKTLRNGDRIELGDAEVQFLLAPTRQRNMRLREWSTWAALVLLFLFQLGIIYSLTMGDVALENLLPD